MSKAADSVESVSEPIGQPPSGGGAGASPVVVVDGQTGETPVPLSSIPSDDSLLGAVEAILLTAAKPATPKRLAEAIGLPNEGGARRIGELTEQLNERYAESGRAFRIEKTAGGLRLMTLPEHADAIAAYHKLGASKALSRAAIETLSMIAYRQPITRASIEAIRGVACGEVLRSLLERRLVVITGRAEEVGRPILYGTGKEFLDQFGLASIKDLPEVGNA